MPGPQPAVCSEDHGLAGACWVCMQKRVKWTAAHVLRWSHFVCEAVPEGIGQAACILVEVCRGLLLRVPFGYNEYLCWELCGELRLLRPQLVPLPDVLGMAHTTSQVVA